MTSAPPLPRLAVMTDFPEEGWPSMDLSAEMLLKHLVGSPLVLATRIGAPFRRRFSFLGGFGRNLDRLVNRLWYYPRDLRRRIDEFDLFHLCDHSYGQLLHELPAGRAGVFCHDLDTFRCILQPAKDPRPRWFRAMARRILRGFQKARVVFYLTAEIRRQIEQFALIDPARLIAAPPAAAEEYTIDADPQVQRETIQRIVGRPRYLMHVGSCIPRKRIDLLLAVFARVRCDGLRLLQVGGEFTPEQRAQIDKSGIAGDIVQARGLQRREIADLYRGAAAVLQTSEAEGFGLPVVEALACGAAVVASDIPVLREVGGDAAIYCPVGDADAWSHAVGTLLDQQASAQQTSCAIPSLAARLAQAARFSWKRHAQTIADAYHRIATEGR